MRISIDDLVRRYEDSELSRVTVTAAIVLHREASDLLGKLFRKCLESSGRLKRELSLDGHGSKLLVCCIGAFSEHTHVSDDPACCSDEIGAGESILDSVGVGGESPEELFAY